MSITLLLAVSAFFQATPLPPSGLIVPGRSVAALTIGSPTSNFKAIFRESENFDPQVSGLTNDCGFATEQWVDLALHATGVIIYSRNNRIDQISVQTPRYSLSSKIKVGSAAKKVRRDYPDGKLYLLRGSGMPVLGGRDLRYWLDQRQGIAFQFYWRPREKMWAVGSIDIFRPEMEFRPESCVSEPRSWEKVVNGRWGTPATGTPDQ